MSSVAIVNHGLCNLDSIRRALEECGAHCVVSSEAKDICSADKLILPGVGAFGDAMKALHELNLVQVLKEQCVEQKVPILGICLGMQLLATKGFESGEVLGLGLIDAQVIKLEPHDNERLPHVGWNSVTPTRAHPLLDGVAGKDFYFVHSYHVKCAKEDDVLAKTPYATSFNSVVAHENIFGTQFHPEKSQRSGFQVLRNFLNY